MPKRKIVTIDESLCNGCGECIPNCQEGALQIINGKARLIGDYACDGLGSCLGHCPMDAIKIEERDADAYVEANVMESDPLACGCPGSMIQNLDTKTMNISASSPTRATSSELTQWPIQLHLVPPSAPFLNNSHLLIAASCSAFSLADFHSDLLRRKKLLIACPKLDNTSPYLDKLVQIFQQNQVKSVTVAIMEVPCCTSLFHLVEEAIKLSGKQIPLIKEVISIHGELK